MDSNQASEQDQLSTTEIHQADQIDDHRVIEDHRVTQSLASDRVQNRESNPSHVDPGKDTWCTIIHFMVSSRWSGQGAESSELRNGKSRKDCSR
jgi:hypothetical protein